MGSKVISFRFDDDKLALLQQHQVNGESENQTAMRLLLGVLGVEGKKPSFQAVDIVDSIRTEIKESIADGGIGEAIAYSYEAAMGQFNGLLSELQELKKQVEELKSNPPAAVAVPPIPQSPFTNEELPETTSPAVVLNHQSPVTNQDIIEFLGIADIVNGAEYWQELIIDRGIDLKILDNANYLESKLNIKITKGYVIARFNSILEALGFKSDKVKPNKQVKTKEGKRQDVYIISQ
ncbi:hypothetical protein [Anabaena catenula]|uniref:Uncharacterized protein n=1 Tax=Anabaena catenula FACHB-362 TaxID=2692877 RepID=A0ABR8JBK8_9NOST|nr:hypothetical protein [Anabaena catenula]MBD2694850.1 hypothetical protein [Anabaena catenula FACHB-362]